MRSYRVHACEPGPIDSTPYLLMGMVDSDQVLLDFDPLEAEPARRVPPLALSVHALYDVIQGQLLRLSRREGTVVLCQEGNELIIDCAESNGSHRRRYRVWLAEVALGWNMLANTPTRGNYIA